MFLFNAEYNLLCGVELGFLQVFYPFVIENIGEGKGCVCGPFYELVVDPGMFISVCYIAVECHGVDLSNCSQLGELFHPEKIGCGFYFYHYNEI